MDIVVQKGTDVGKSEDISKFAVEYVLSEDTKRIIKEREELLEAGFDKEFGKDIIMTFSFGDNP